MFLLILCNIEINVVLLSNFSKFYFFLLQYLFLLFNLNKQLLNIL